MKGERRLESLRNKILLFSRGDRSQETQPENRNTSLLNRIPLLSKLKRTLTSRREEKGANAYTQLSDSSHDQPQTNQKPEGRKRLLRISKKSPEPKLNRVEQYDRVVALEALEQPVTSELSRMREQWWTDDRSGVVPECKLILLSPNRTGRKT